MGSSASYGGSSVSNGGSIASYMGSSVSNGGSSVSNGGCSASYGGSSVSNGGCSASYIRSNASYEGPVHPKWGAVRTIGYSCQSTLWSLLVSLGLHREDLQE